VKAWLRLAGAEVDKLRSDVILRAVVLALLLGPLVMVVILRLAAPKVSSVIENPGEIPLATTVLLAAVGAAVLAASAFGREYDMGTVRTILARGVPRADWITAKIAVVMTTLSLTGLISAGIGLIALSLAGWQAEGGEVVGSLLRASVLLPLACLVYGGMSAIGSVLGRSAAAGMLAGLTLFLGEFLLSTMRDRIPFGEWLPISNLFSMIGGVFASILRPDDSVSAGTAAFRLLSVGVGLLLSAILIFRQRDVTG